MNNYNSSTMQDEISNTCLELIFEDAFFGHFLLSINREISTKGPTLWVRPTDDDKVIMGFNPEFWNGPLSDKKFRMGGIKHEVLHVVFKHITRQLEQKDGISKFQNQRIFNIAADLVVNQYIEPSWLIEGAVNLEMFSELNLRKEMDVGYYYDKLEELYRKTPQQPSACPDCGRSMEGETGTGDEAGAGEGEGDEAGAGESEGDEAGAGESEGDEAGAGESEGDSCSTCGQSGKGTGKDGEGEGDEGDSGAGGSGESSESMKELGRLMSEAPGSRGGYHGEWREMKERTETQREVLEEWIDRQIVNSVNRLDSTDTWGNLPGSLVDYLNEFTKSRKPKVDWRRNLRLFTENSQQTYITNTLKKPSRRYKKIAIWPDGSPMYEMKNGKPVKDKTGNFIPVWEAKYPGLKVRKRTQILAGIDTSGSLNIDTDLPMIFNELNHLTKQEVEITVVEIDEWIQRIYLYPLPDLSQMTEVKGRGGTDFNEMLKYANGEEIVRSGGLRGHSHQGIQVWKAGRWVEEFSVKLRTPADGIIYFTDGQANTPAEEVKTPILWVIGGSYALSSTDELYEALPGQKVIIEN